MTSDSESRLVAGTKVDDLAFINQSIRQCTNCPLARSPVPGSGNAEARALILGQQTGVKEEQSGIPFTGPSGQVLNDIFQIVGLRRSQFFITNAIRCLPPKGHSISVPELDACDQWTEAQLEVLDPAIVVLCGRYALGKYYQGMKNDRNKALGMGDVHGKPRRLWNRILIPVYHPAYIAYRMEADPRIFDVAVQDWTVVYNLLEDVSSAPM